MAGLSLRMSFEEEDEGGTQLVRQLPQLPTEAGVNEKAPASATPPLPGPPPSPTGAALLRSYLAAVANRVEFPPDYAALVQCHVQDRLAAYAPLRGWLPTALEAPLPAAAEAAASVVTAAAPHGCHASAAPTHPTPRTQGRPTPLT